ncbi:MAG TPA: clostripain-related cysteine peptidase, partial [Blastocatellia bacterium]|nr:clostripain-related cysteine peptidase [Blastocatellia bacterium]
MDSCLMSMAEVATELSGKVDYLIGAEGYELNLGWPYHRLMEALNRASREGITLRTLAGQLVNDYVRYYSDYVIAGVSVDQAVCDLNRAPDLNNAVRWLKDELIEGLEESAILDAVIVAHWRAQSYHAEQYVDLWDFCDHLSRSRTCRQNEGLLKACRSVKEIIEGREAEGIRPFVLKSRYCGAAFQHSHGVSIYFPWATDTADVKDFENLRQYAQLKFHQETGWGTFLEEYLVRSRLPIRNQELHPNDPPLYFITPDDRRTVVRTNTPDLRTNYPELRGGGNPVAKVKNPPLGFYPESDE